MTNKDMPHRYIDYLELARIATKLGASDADRGRRKKRRSAWLWDHLSAIASKSELTMPPSTVTSQRALLSAYSAGYHLWDMDRLHNQETENV